MTSVLLLSHVSDSKLSFKVKALTSLLLLLLACAEHTCKITHNVLHTEDGSIVHFTTDGLLTPVIVL